MAAGLDLSPFWDLLETNFPLAGSRSELRARLGPGLVTALERGQILAYLRPADRVACPHPGGTGCPRHVIRLSDGRLHGVCGNDPPECEDLGLSQDDIEILGVEPAALGKALRQPLHISGRVEALTGLRGVYLTGSYIPEPSVKHPVYFVARCSEREYSEAFDALRSRSEGGSLAILVPTDRFVDANTTRQMGTLGIPVIHLRDLIELDTDGHLTGSIEARRLFGGIGTRRAAGAALTDPIVAEVLSHDGWRELDEAAYSQLVASAGDYDLLADERGRTLWKRVDGRKRPSHVENIQASYFEIIRAAVESTGYFDPGAYGSEEQVAWKQIFQRSRKTMDVKYQGAEGSPQWRLFKTVMVDDHAEYQFKPDPGFRFALIFLPR